MKRLTCALLALICAAPVAAVEPWRAPLQLERTEWSATLIGQYILIDPSDRSDDRGEFFDQYEWTANRGSSFPFELGIRDGSLDMIGLADTPLLQARLRSATSNLGVSGSQVDEPFFNQHIDLLGRIRGLSLDLRYDRIRTEQLRRYPNTAGAGLRFNDLSDPDDRFFRDRTGVAGELRLQPYLALDHLNAPGSRLSPELLLRGGYQSRGGTQQLNFVREPSNTWLGVAQKADRDVWNIGSGLVLTPLDDTTLHFDYDYERFRWKSDPILESDLGFTPRRGEPTIGFVPDSDRSTATVQLRSRPHPRAHLRAGFRFSQLEQRGDFTPNQKAAGQDDNRVRYYSANADLRFELWPSLELLAALHYDRRSNDIDRSTAVFNRSDTTQVDAFLWRFDRIVARMELHQSLRRLGGVTLGISYEDIDRDLQFSTAPPRILPENSWVKDRTRFVAVYARGSLRPLKGLKLFGEIGYRDAPDTGYITELDDYVYGKLRVSYVVPASRPVIVTGFLRGHRGENKDFETVFGVGPNPSGPSRSRHLEQSAIGGGVTLSHSPRQNLSVYASFHAGRNEQETGLDLSDLQRYFQDIVPLTFPRAGENRFHDRQLSFVAGASWRFAERIDTAFSYTFTQAKGEYRDATSRELQRIDDSYEIDSNIHGIDLEVGTWLRKGMRVLAGYRLQLFDNDSEVRESIASVVQPEAPSTYQHTFTVGVQLTSDFFSSD